MATVEEVKSSATDVAKAVVKKHVSRAQLFFEAAVKENNNGDKRKCKKLLAATIACFLLSGAFITTTIVERAKGLEACQDDPRPDKCELHNKDFSISIAAGTLAGFSLLALILCCCGFMCAAHNVAAENRSQGTEKESLRKIDEERENTYSL